MRRIFLPCLFLLAGLMGCASAAQGEDTRARRQAGNPPQGETAGEGEGETAGEGEGEAVGEGEGEGEPVGEGEGEVAGEGEGEPPASLRVLLIGNSQLGLNPPDVAAALQSLSRVAHNGASVLVVDRKQHFGEGCRQFLARPDVTAAAGSGDYDVVVLLPAIFEGPGEADCWDDFRQRAEDSGSVFGIMATAHVLGSYPSGFISLHNAIKTYATAHGVLLIPAGQVWRRIIGDAPTTAQLSEFYSADGQHPGAEGDLIYVYTLYAALTGRSAVGLPADVVELRCKLGQTCLSYSALDDCVADNGTYHCGAQNGALFGPNNSGVSFVSAAEAANYQAAVDAVLAE